MKLLFSLFIAFAGLSTMACGQKPAAKALASPAATATGKVGKANATVTIEYHQPSVKGRKIWGGLVPFDQVWRTGANEATTFETSADLKVGGKVLKAGKYALFTIPKENGNWTVIFNKTVKQWGAYDYKAADDVLRIDATSKKSNKMYELFTVNVQSKDIEFLWDNLEVEFTVETL